MALRVLGTWRLLLVLAVLLKGDWIQVLFFRDMQLRVNLLMFISFGLMI